MLDNETRADIKYLALIKQKEQLEKEIKELEEQNREAKTGITKTNLEQVKNYFKD